MKKKKTKKNRIVLIFCTILVCLCSVISFIPFKQDKLSVKADEVSTNGFSFTGSYLPFNYTFFDADIASSYNTSTNVVYYMKLKYFFTSDANNILTTLGTDFTIPIWKNSNFNGNFVRNFNSSNLNNSNFTIYSSALGAYGTTWNALLGGSEYQRFRIYASTFNDDGYIVMGQPIKFTWQVGRDFGYVCDILTYYDTNNNKLIFYHFFNSVTDTSSLSYYGNFGMSLRTYYLNPPNLSDNQYYQEGFAAGQTNGYNNGYNVGQSEGYNNGYNVGQNVGYNNGYTAGSEDSNQYTFLNLISATIDAPVKYFQSLFNFELLGVNLQSFLTGLFTLCVIVTIVKLCLGG